MTKNRNIPSSATDEAKPLPVGWLFGKNWEVGFDEPDLPSDAGLAALLSSGIGNRLLSQLAAGIDDPRRTPFHSIEQQVRQRVFQIIGGYFDANDSDFLRDDIVMRAAAGKELEDGGLASQPTISRLEGNVSKSDWVRMAGALFEDYPR